MLLNGMECMAQEEVEQSDRPQAGWVVAGGRLLRVQVATCLARSQIGLQIGASCGGPKPRARKARSEMWKGRRLFLQGSQGRLRVALELGWHGGQVGLFWRRVGLRFRFGLKFVQVDQGGRRRTLEWM